MPEVPPVVAGLRNYLPPPPPDALALSHGAQRGTIQRESLSEIPRPPHERNQKPAEIADPPRVERRPRRDHDPRNDVGIGVHLRPQESRPYPKLGAFVLSRFATSPKPSMAATAARWNGTLDIWKRKASLLFAPSTPAAMVPGVNRNGFRSSR